MVGPTQRFSQEQPCPVCGGHGRLPRGQGQRCYGFLSTDGRYGHCSREEYAGPLPLETESDTYAHRLDGDCRCGRVHGPAQAHRPIGVSINRSPVVAVYDYEDASGHTRFQVVRRADKTFTQRRPDGAGDWIYNLAGVEPLLYRTPQLLDADANAWVFVVEGEKDADRLRSLGAVATCNPMGAGKWKRAYSEALRGRRVAIIPDDDEPGHRHAEHVARSLSGLAAAVKVVRL